MILTKPRKIALAAVSAVMIFLGGLGIALGVDNDSPTAQPAVTASAARLPAPVPASDPYAVYLATNPSPKLVLSREDAQTRAYLGCGVTFAAGTIDAALAAAYRPGICAPPA